MSLTYCFFYFYDSWFTFSTAPIPPPFLTVPNLVRYFSGCPNHCSHFFHCTEPWVRHCSWTVPNRLHIKSTVLRVQGQKSTYGPKKVSYSEFGTVPRFTVFWVRSKYYCAHFGPCLRRVAPMIKKQFIFGQGPYSWFKPGCGQ